MRLPWGEDDNPTSHMQLSGAEKLLSLKMR